MNPEITISTIKTIIIKTSMESLIYRRVHIEDYQRLKTR